MRDYKKYNVWDLGHKLTLSIYQETKEFPNEEKYGIIGQMRRASYSIPANISEGCGRESDSEFVRYLFIARGSASELEYFLILSKDLGYLSNQKFDGLYDQANLIKRSLSNLIKKIK